MVETPFIKLFCTPNAKYFFDVNKNEIIPISETSFQYLNSIFSTNLPEPCMPEELVKLKGHGYLATESAVKKVRHVYSDKLEILLDRKINKITLQLTQNCNFRCKYCVYTEKPNSKQRAHSPKCMNWETAKEAIDFFWLHSIDSQQVNIGLYGGEPLLEFPLIKKIIEYSEQQFFGKKLTFSITTNATLLSEEMIFYFRDHDVSLMISLDGPKDINDKNRVFVNGEGTYETVIKHIELVKKVAPEYYKKLMISMVVDPGNDFDCINNAFVTGAKLDTLTIQPSGIDHTFDGQKTTISDDYSWKYEYQHFLAILSYFRRFPENLVSPIAMSPFASSIIENERVGQGAPLLSVDAPSGPCIPGKLRLFIDVNGKFYPCERVSEKSIVMNLGSIKDGFNFHKAYQIMNVGQLTESDCIQCWCFRYCIQCAKTADLESSELSAKARLSRCGEVRTMVYSKLYQYLLLNELPVYYGNQIRTEEEGKES